MVSCNPHAEIPSSLELRPIGVRLGDPEKVQAMSRPNPKYNNIQSRIDHGKKVELNLDDNFKVTRAKGEDFGRITTKVLAQYISGGRSALNADQQLNDVQALRTGFFPSKRPPIQTEQTKIMLVDLRPIQDYLDSHIRKALSMPATSISIDRVFSQLNIYKNKPNVLLVFYNDDERHGMQQIQIIFEKGFDNCYLLSGGFCVFSKQFPDLVDGSGIESRTNTAPDIVSARSKQSRQGRRGQV